MVLAHLAAGEWRAPEALLSQTATTLTDSGLIRADRRGRLVLTREGRDALDCLLTAPEPAPVDSVTRVVLSLRLCLLDRLPPEERASRPMLWPPPMALFSTAAPPKWNASAVVSPCSVYGRANVPDIWKRNATSAPVSATCSVCPTPWRGVRRPGNTVPEWLWTFPPSLPK